MTLRMKVRSVAVPWQIHIILEKMKCEGLISSVSEYFRKALEQQLIHDIILIREVIQDNNLIELIQEVVPEVLETPTTITINGRVWQKQ